MNVCVRELIEAFPDREVTLTTRADGRLSLTIAGEAQPALRKVIDCETVLSRAQVGSLIRELVRDVQASGENRSGQGVSWLARELPAHDLASPFATRAFAAHGDDLRPVRASC